MTLAKQLLESLKKIEEMSPIDLNKSAPWGDFGLGNILDSSLDRDFNLLCQIKDMYINIYIRKSLSEVVAIKIDPVNGRNKIVVSLRFQPHRMSIPNSLQVDIVSGDREFRSQGLTTALYLATAYIGGFNIISDFTQYEDGIKLWKRISSTDIHIFNIRLYNAQTEEYVKDSNGDDIIYHPDNISSDKVWSTDNSKENIVLVLSKKLY